MAIDSKFIADIIFPVYPVETDTGEYMRILRGKGQLLSKSGGDTDATDPLVRAPGTEYREVTRTEEKDSWKTLDRGLREVIDDKLKQKVARFYDKEASTAKLLMRNIRISRESRVAAKVFNETNFGTAIDATGSTSTMSEANIATFDFAAYLLQAKLLIEKRQEDAFLALTISNVMWDRVLRSTLLRQYFFGTAGGSAMITKQMIIEKFGLSDVLVGKGSYDSSKVGKNATDSTLVWTWPDTYFGIFNIVGGPPEMGGCGRTFCLEQMTGGQLFVTESDWDWKTRATTIRVRQDDDTKIVNENSGVLVKTGN